MTAAATTRLPARRRPGGPRALVLVVLATLLVAAVLTPVTATPAAATPVAAAPERTAARPASAPQTPAVAPQTPAVAPQAEDQTPLKVSIRTMTPSTLPRRGRVTLTGEVTNRSESTWTDLYADLFISSTPMTTAAELDEATASDEAAVVAPRLSRPSLFDELPDLEPGETTDYRVSVPRRLLPRGPGVYWIGIHVLGSDETGRTVGADGRARTFISSVPPGGPRSTLSLAVPFRAPLLRTAEGQVANLTAWEQQLADDGRLDRLLEMVGGADFPLSIVVDPAVLEAARSLAAANPEFDLGPTDDPAEESTGPEAPLTEEPGPVQEGNEDGAPDDVTELSPEAQRAADWLTAFSDLAEQQSVLALPYGDLDVAAALRRKGHAATYERAKELSALTMEDLGIGADPVVAPPDGLLPRRAVDGLDPETMLLLSERAADTDATTIRLGEHEALLGNDVAKTGGPAPTPPFGALAVRQQILAEAAVHALAGSDDPLVVSLPDRWNPGADWQEAAFFAGLQAPWVRTVNVDFARALSSGERYDGRLAYSREQRREELPRANLRTTRRLGRTGTVLAELLSRNDTIDEQVGRAAMLGSSVNARAYPRGARNQTREIRSEMRRRLGAISVESSSLVTMSSETGSFQVTVVNELEEPVTVGIAAEADGEGLEIRSPDLVSLGAGQRASVRLSVTASGSGVHSVRIRPTTPEGDPIGQSTKVALRSSQVGLVIWLVMGTGAVVFVAAIAARIVRRVRSRRAAGAENEEDAVA